VGVLNPVRERYAEITADPELVPRLLEQGARKASAVASHTLLRARQAIGLLAPLSSKDQVEVPVLDIAEEPREQALVEEHQQKDQR